MKNSFQCRCGFQSETHYGHGVHSNEAHGEYIEPTRIFTHHAIKTAPKAVVKGMGTLQSKLETDRGTNGED